MTLTHPFAPPPRKLRHLELVPPLTQPIPTAVEFSNPLMTRLGVKGWSRTVYKGNLAVRYAFLESPQPTEATPVGIGRGFMGTRGAYLPIAAHMAALGRNVAIVQSVKRLQPIGAVRLPHILDILRVQAQANGAMLENMMMVDGTGPADAYLHSQGVLTGSRLAARKPGLFRSINCVAGAGMSGHRNPSIVVSRIPAILRHEVVPNGIRLLENLGADTGRELTRDLIRYPFGLLRQGLTDTMSDARPGLRFARDAGVKVGATIYEDDSFFYPGEIVAASESSLSPSAIQILPGTIHIEPQLNPEDQAIAHLEFSRQLIQATS